jgi:hypothetical protein
MNTFKIANKKPDGQCHQRSWKKILMGFIWRSLVAEFFEKDKEILGTIIGRKIS